MSKVNSESVFPSLLLSRLEGKLYFDGLDINELINQIGTPAFIFSENQLLKQYNTLQRAFGSILRNPFKLAFSIKSNPLPDILI
jgi:diaminopimelate decarboxylase